MLRRSTRLALRLAPASWFAVAAAGTAGVLTAGNLAGCNTSAPAAAPVGGKAVAAVTSPATGPSAESASASASAAQPGGTKSAAGRTAHALDAGRAAALDAFIEEAMAKTGVPGAAIAVVQGGKVVHERGFGTREAGKDMAVSPHTLFMIGSTTKPLTSLLVAKLVDEGKLAWTTPVQEILPSFGLADADVSRAMTVENTLCACAGLPRLDLELFFAQRTMSAEERIASMHLMKPTARLGEKYQYSNVMLAAAGYIAGHAAVPEKRLAPAYEEAMQTRVFGPLGMAETTLDAAVAVKKDHAMPHAQTLDEAYVPIALTDESFVVPIRPAGATWSSVHDMSRYVALELAKGRDAEGHVVVSEANLMKRREPQVDSGAGTSYGLGLWVDTAPGNQWLGHTGGTLGFRARVFAFPEFDWGYVLLFNASDEAFGTAVQERLHEVIFDRPSHATEALDRGLAASHEELATTNSHAARTPPADWVAGLSGTYEDATLGKVVVRSEGGRGVFDAGEWKSSFGKFERDGRTGLILLDPPLGGLVFYPDSGRNANADPGANGTGPRSGRNASLSLETPEMTYVLTRVPRAAVATGGGRSGPGRDGGGGAAQTGTLTRALTHARGDRPDTP
jgi:CubicO group peptidase (beta-lactamase class C family)